MMIKKFSFPKIWFEPMFFYGFFCGFERCGSAAFPNFRGGFSSPPQAAKAVRTIFRIEHLGAWKDIENGKGVFVYDWSLNEASSSITSNGLIKGTFTADSVSVAYGRVDAIAVQSFFLEPVYIFSGILDTGKQKLPLKAWASAAVIN